MSVRGAEDSTPARPGITPLILPQGEAAWDAGMGDDMKALQSTEGMVAGNIVSRASQLQSGAQQSALIFGIITVAVLLFVMLAAVLVARSLVLPLRRLRAGALEHRLGPAARAGQAAVGRIPGLRGDLEVAPINVTTRG